MLVKEMLGVDAAAVVFPQSSAAVDDAKISAAVDVGGTAAVPNAFSQSPTGAVDAKSSAGAL